MKVASQLLWCFCPCPGLEFNSSFRFQYIQFSGHSMMRRTRVISINKNAQQPCVCGYPCSLTPFKRGRWGCCIVFAWSFSCMCVHAALPYRVPFEATRGCWISWDCSYRWCGLPCWHWKLNPGPLQKHQVLLTDRQTISPAPREVFNTNSIKHAFNPFYRCEDICYQFYFIYISRTDLC